MSNNELTTYFSSLVVEPLKITEGSNSKKENDYLFKGDLTDLNSWLVHEEFRLKKKIQNSERKLREDNAKKAFYFSIGWAIFIAVFILLHSFEQVNYFKITSTEFMFVCGTLTTSILIFYLTVIKSLFPAKSE